MWGFLAISHDPITAIYNLSNKKYFGLGLLENLSDILRTVDIISKILGIFVPFNISRYGIPLGALYYFSAEWTFNKFDVYQTPLEAGCSITSETGTPSPTELSFTYSIDCNDMSIFILFYGATLGWWLGVLIGSSSNYGVNQVYLGSIFYGAILCKLIFTRSIQFGSIMPYLINGTVENSSSNTAWNWGDTWTVDGFRSRATDPAWNGECPRYTPSRERGYHLGSPSILTYNLSYIT